MYFKTIDKREILWWAGKSYSGEYIPLVGIVSILSFFEIIGNTVLNRQTYCIWWHLVLKGLMFYHQESHPELAFSNCEYSVKMYLIFWCIFVSIFIVIKLLSSRIGWLSIWYLSFVCSCICFLWFLLWPLFGKKLRSHWTR